MSKATNNTNVGKNCYEDKEASKALTVLQDITDARVVKNSNGEIDTVCVTAKPGSIPKQISRAARALLLFFTNKWIDHRKITVILM